MTTEPSTWKAPKQPPTHTHQGAPPSFSVPGQLRAKSSIATSSTAAPTAKETDVARTRLPTQLASCALIPNWIGSIAPAATSNT